nr:diguanylate cyclase regulator RdcB family protein [uncultured Duganella sp.]
MTQSDSTWAADPLCGLLSALPEKFIVDFANGIDVVRDHNAVQRQRENSIYARLYDGFTGQGQRRQNDINASLADGIDGALTWLTELTNSLSRSNRTIELVQARVASLQSHLTSLAHHSANTREQLQQLAQQLTLKINSVERDVARLDRLQRAELQLRLVMSKWEAGQFAMLPIAGRCYAALEELRWGDFGHFYHHAEPGERAGHLELLRNLVVTRLAEDARSNSGQRQDTLLWLQTAPAGLPDLQLALAYLGNWAQPKQSPFVFVAANLPDVLPDHMPRLCSATRLSHAMVHEVIVEGAA